MRNMTAFNHRSGLSLHWRSTFMRSSIPLIADWLECDEDDIEMEDFVLSDDDYVEAVFCRGELVGFLNEDFTDELAARVVAARMPSFSIAAE